MTDSGDQRASHWRRDALAHLSVCEASVLIERLGADVQQFGDFLRGHSGKRIGVDGHIGMKPSETVVRTIAATDRRWRIRSLKKTNRFSWTMQIHKLQSNP
jgi:hypothetical protein